MKRNLKYILLAVPFLAGTAGLLMTGEFTVTDAMFTSMLMYVANYGDAAPNMLVEFARWSALLASAGSIILILGRLRESLKNLYLYRKGGSVAVYGETAEETGFSGMNIIRGEEDFVRAERYILLKDDAWNFAFVSRNAARLKETPVYMCTAIRRPQFVPGSSIRLFSIEEIAARLFWNSRDEYPVFRENGGHLDIVIIGEGRLTEELLYWGLQKLIFSAAQQITYHIFAKESSFAGLHPQLSRIEDPVVFHAEPWYAQKDLLEAADEVIITERKTPEVLTDALLSVLNRRQITVFAEDGLWLKFIDGQERIQLFLWKQLALQPAHIIGEDLQELSIRINLRYAHLYQGIEETEENGMREWQKLDSFTRYSNISAADYQQVRMNMLQDMGMDISSLDDGTVDMLAELEHIRWCRYHYLNNWQYGIPENGKAKDNENRIHSLLVPYRMLSEEEKEKDRSNVRLLLSLNTKQTGEK